MSAKTARLKRIVPVLLILVLGTAGYLFFKQGQAGHERLVYYGSVDIRQVQSAFFSTGRILNMSAQEGDRVKAGQLIAELDATRYETAVRRAEAQVAMQEQVVARLQAGSRPEEIAGAEAHLRAAQAVINDATQKLARAEVLATNDYVSRQQLDDARTAVATARAGFDAARQTYQLALLGPRREEIAAAEAKLEADRAALALARQELADTRLYAAANGVIQNRILEPGDMASPQLPVYTLALVDPVWVRAYVPEPELGKVAEGMAAEVTTDSYPDKVYHGWVGYIAPTAEFTPKQVQTTDLRTRLVYQVRIYVENADNELRMGMPATVRIIPGKTREN